VVAANLCESRQQFPCLGVASVELESLIQLGLGFRPLSVLQMEPGQGQPLAQDRSGPAFQHAQGRWIDRIPFVREQQQGHPGPHILRGDAHQLAQPFHSRCAVAPDICNHALVQLRVLGTQSEIHRRLQIGLRRLGSVPSQRQAGQGQQRWAVFIILHQLGAMVGLIRKWDSPVQLDLFQQPGLQLQAGIGNRRAAADGIDSDGITREHPDPPAPGPGQRIPDEPVSIGQGPAIHARLKLPSLPIGLPLGRLRPLKFPAQFQEIQQHAQIVWIQAVRVPEGIQRAGFISVFRLQQGEVIGHFRSQQQQIILIRTHQVVFRHGVCGEAAHPIPKRALRLDQGRQSQAVRRWFQPVNEPVRRQKAEIAEDLRHVDDGGTRGPLVGQQQVVQELTKLGLFQRFPQGFGLKPVRNVLQIGG